MLFLGFSLGLMHALDADHIMAVSVLSGQRPGLLTSVYFCTRWAIGHGAVLTAVAVLLFVFGWGLPDGLQQLAELVVGGMLIALGCACLWQLQKERIHLEAHRHGDIVHMHWLEDGHKTSGSHKPTMVGALHGLAGSAPVLALFPLTEYDQMLAIAYVLVFSLAVMVSMLLFGMGLGSIQKLLLMRYAGVMLWFRRLIAVAAIALGGVWISYGV